MTERQPKPQATDMSAPAPEGEGSSPETDTNAAAHAAEIAGLKDQVLRALADAENTRRRAQKEREDTSKYAVANFAKEMLNVADNFHRALDATPKETNDPALRNLITGIEATERQLQAALERFGIKKIDPLGQAFDPNFHRVMMEVDDPDQQAGTVVQVLQSGYIIHDRLLREALVAVAKGVNGGHPKVDTSA
jgi:molecular chaperone GrpE